MGRKMNALEGIFKIVGDDVEVEGISSGYRVYTQKKITAQVLEELIDSGFHVWKDLLHKNVYTVSKVVK
jgi:hypothetical protein